MKTFKQLILLLIVINFIPNLAYTAETLVIPTISKWQARIYEDTFTDERKAFVALPIDGGKQIMMYACVGENKGRFIVKVNEYMAETFTNITYRFDKTDPGYMQGMVNGDNTSVILFFEGDGVAFAKLMAKHEQLALKISTYQSSETMIIDLSGFTAAVEKACPGHL